jgi:hypothetical protein
MQDDSTVLRLAERGRAPRARASGCFDDEIAIDFPSVAPLVERLCERFLGGDVEDEHLWAEVRLSRHDAASGRPAPLALLLRATCSRCGGRGETWQEPCESCEGRGVRRVRREVAVPLPADVRDGAQFVLTVDVAGVGLTRVHLRVSVP